MECCWSVPFVCHVVQVDGAWLVMLGVVEGIALEASGRIMDGLPDFLSSADVLLTGLLSV